MLHPLRVLLLIGGVILNGLPTQVVTGSRLPVRDAIELEEFPSDDASNPLADDATDNDKKDVELCQGTAAADIARRPEGPPRERAASPSLPRAIHLLHLRI